MKSTRYQSGAALLETDIYPADGVCPICGDTRPRRAAVVIQQHPRIALLSCQRCLGYSASHMPTREALDRYYGSYYEHVEGERVTFYKPARLARRIASSVTLPPSGQLTILDFGGGDGTIGAMTASLLVRKTRQSARVQVIDYVDGSPRQDGAVGIEFLKNLTEASASCDIVIASGVFEHIPELAAVMPEVIERLRPGGYLYARTPYMLPFMKWFGMDMTYPGHVHDLGDRFWGHLPSWFSVPLEIVHSRPSIVQSGLRKELIATIAAHTFKLPSRVEALWTHNPRFRLYGGWEVVMRRQADV